MNTRKRSVPVIFLLACLLVPGLVAAEQEASSELLLPYFEVDMDDGLTTLFAVSNASPQPASFDITLYSNWGIEVLTVPAKLEGGGVLAVNLADWLLHGRLPKETLDADDLEHLQAALCGHRSPKTDLFYGTEVAPRLAVGYVKITGSGSPKPDDLWGDYFITDPFQDFAQGDSLISLADGCAGACDRHALRFLAGGAFDGGTQVIVWTGQAGQPSETGFYREKDLVAADTSYFDMDGNLSEARTSSFKAVEVVEVSELGLSDSFGWLEIWTAQPSFVNVRYSAMNRFSVGLRSFCLKTPSGPGVRLEKSTNGQDADSAPGPAIEVGDHVSWTYVVTNIGSEDLFDVAVSDDRGVDVICPGDSLEIGQRMTCSGHGVAVRGQYRNTGTVVGWTADGTEVTDSDRSHYYGTPEDDGGSDDGGSDDEGSDDEGSDDEGSDDEGDSDSDSDSDKGGSQKSQPLFARLFGS